MRYFNLIKNINNWWLYLGVKLKFVQNDPLLFKARQGIRVEVPLRLLHTFKEIFMEECYMHGLKQEMPDSPVIFDIGANAGYFSLYAASQFLSPSIYAFEPMPANYKQLIRNISLNQGCRIFPFNMAVSKNIGEVTMISDSLNGFSTVAQISDHCPVGERIHQIKVPSTTIQKIFDDNQLKVCDFLKIDCEGAEHEIFYTCPQEYLKRINFLGIEVHGEIEPLKKFFIENGFITYETNRTIGMLYAWQE
jgi:FkbM family methyltransferase